MYLALLNELRNWCALREWFLGDPDVSLDQERDVGLRGRPRVCSSLRGGHVAWTVYYHETFPRSVCLRLLAAQLRPPVTAIDKLFRSVPLPTPGADASTP